MIGNGTFDDYLEFYEANLMHGDHCDICRYSDICNRMTAGPDGAIFPPCADYDVDDYVDEDMLRDVVDEYVGDMKDEG